MAQIKRTEIDKLLADNDILNTCQVYLFFGERYLCREACDLLLEKLTSSSATVHPIDGDSEDQAKTISLLMSFSLLPGNQIFKITDSRLFLAKSITPSLWEKALQANKAGNSKNALRQLARMLSSVSTAYKETGKFSDISSAQWEKTFGFSKPPEDLSWCDTLFENNPELKSSKATSTALQFMEALEKGFAQSNILILTVETVDKRQKLFKTIEKQGTVIDCSVDTGASNAAQKVQKEVVTNLVHTTLKEFNKRIEPAALEMFMERSGFHPAGIVMETEKLALYAEESDTITCDHVNTMVGRTREDALFELTDAFSKNQLDRTILILTRLLENNVHGLAILATLRNHVRKLLLYRSIQLMDHPRYQNNMNAGQFQKMYLPALKEQNIWPDMLKGHPYALFMSFSRAAQYSCPQLKNYLFLLLQAEYQLKSSPLEQQLVLQELMLSMFNNQPCTLS